MLAHAAISFTLTEVLTGAGGSAAASPAAAGAASAADDLCFDLRRGLAETDSVALGGAEDKEGWHLLRGCGGGVEKQNDIAISKLQTFSGSAEPALAAVAGVAGGRGAGGPPRLERGLVMLLTPGCCSGMLAEGCGARAMSVSGPSRSMFSSSRRGWGLLLLAWQTHECPGFEQGAPPGCELGVLFQLPAMRAGMGDDTLLMVPPALRAGCSYPSSCAPPTGCRAPSPSDSAGSWKKAASAARAAAMSWSMDLDIARSTSLMGACGDLTGTD
ncbi:MAG: hypothetical protein FRX49_05673 [Trebouxia sp. A1-2]|nr:MAG: hypothetical protein FRX49_05673 [Trebouxia sp. A1-2]